MVEDENEEEDAGRRRTGDPGNNHGTWTTCRQVRTSHATTEEAGPVL